MNIHIINNKDPLWLLAQEYVGACSWDACARMAQAMKAGKFSDWERVFVAEENGCFMGFCALLKPQSFPGREYAPLLKWLFVDEKHRGRRLSERLIEAACEYAKELGRDQVFLTTWHKGLYEKYGFVKTCDMEVRDGYSEGVYGKKIR